MLECGMLEQDSRTLRRRSAALLKHLVVDEMLLQLLQAEDVLTENMAEGIMAERTSQKQSWRLLQILPKRGPRAFSCFCAALRETNQQFLSDMLAQSPERDGVERHAKRLSDSCTQDQDLDLDQDQYQTAAKRARTQESMEYSLDADGPIKSPVLPCSAGFYHSHCQKAYRMTSSPRGLALIISNLTFDPPPELDLDLGYRMGGEVDNQILTKLFTELNYQVSLFVDLKAEAMKLRIQDFCLRPDLQAVDSCVVCLLSHGVDGAVYGTDGELLQLDWVFKAFDNVHCPLLQNKPKMFFIQACRGEEMDAGVEQIDGPVRTASPSCEQRDAGRERQNGSPPGDGGDGGGLRVKLPQRSDMICGFASLKGTAAMRNTKRGSWFIQDLDMALRLHARDTHLADILVQVNGRIKQREGFAPGTPQHRCKEMSEFTSSLCKDLYLFPRFRPQS